MQWCAAMSVGLINVGTIVHQLVGHGVLPSVACHVQRRVPISITVINLKKERSVL